MVRKSFPDYVKLNMLNFICNAFLIPKTGINLILHIYSVFSYMSENSDFNMKTGIVVFNHGAFGGAAKRFTNLFLYLNKKYPGIFYYIINKHLRSQIGEIYPNLPEESIKIVDLESIRSSLIEKSIDKPSEYKDRIEDPLAIDMKTTLPRKVFWYYKNKFTQNINLFFY